MKFLPIFFAVFLVFSACKQKNATPPVETVSTSDDQLPADFITFYEKFHLDSVYQMTHISWPLQGDKSEQLDSTHYAKQETTWEQSKWHLHHPVDYSSGDYKRKIQMLGDGLVIEYILITAGGYGIERRFARQPDGEWNLIYYSDMQERGK